MGLKPRSWYDEQSKQVREYLVAYQPPWPKMARWPSRFWWVCQSLNRKAPVLDLGCGPGLFATYLWHSGFHERYLGVDFAEHNIQRARQGNKGVGHQRAEFLAADLTGVIFEELIASFAVPPQITILETFEHLQKDVELLERLPSGTQVVLTVPTFDEPSHVWFFLEPHDVLKQYGHLFEDPTTRKIRRHWILLKGVRR